MNTNTREPRSPESYSTFWEPLDTTPAPAQSAGTATDDSPVQTKDAYLEFTEITEGVPARRCERS